jgi:hypothetical protein
MDTNVLEEPDATIFRVEECDSSVENMKVGGSSRVLIDIAGTTATSQKTVILNFLCVLMSNSISFL